MAENDGRRKRGQKRTRRSGSGSRERKGRIAWKRSHPNSAWFVKKKKSTSREDALPLTGAGAAANRESRPPPGGADWRSLPSRSASILPPNPEERTDQMEFYANEEVLRDWPEPGSGSYLPHEPYPAVYPAGNIVTAYLKEKGFKLLGQMASGAYSTVYGASYRPPHRGPAEPTVVYGKPYHPSVRGPAEPMACKVIDLVACAQMNPHYVGIRLKYELDFLRRIIHPNIVRTFRIFEPEELTTGSTVYIFMELMAKDLWHYIFRESTTQRPEETIKKLMVQVCRGLQHLHGQNLAHMDLKPENILLDATQTVAKLTDFSHLKHVLVLRTNPVVRMLSIGLFGTDRYRAPEMEEIKMYNPLQTDMYSLGVVLFVALTRNYPYTYRTIQERLAAAKVQSYSFTNLWTLTDEARSAIYSTLEYDPKRRITIENLLNHSWFHSLQ